MPIYLLLYVVIVLNSVLPTAYFSLCKFEIERTLLQRKDSKNCWKNSIFPLVVYVYTVYIFRVPVFVIQKRVSHFTRSIGQHPLCSVDTEQVQCPFGRVCSTVYSIHHFRKSGFFLNSHAIKHCKVQKEGFFPSDAALPLTWTGDSWLQSVQECPAWSARAGRSCSGSTHWTCSREGHLALVSASTRTGRTIHELGNWHVFAGILGT